MVPTVTEAYPTQQNLDDARAAAGRRERRVEGLISERASLKANINLPGILQSTKTRYRKNIKRLNRRIKRIDRRVSNPFKVLYKGVAAKEEEARRRAANAFGISKTLQVGMAPREGFRQSVTNPLGPTVSRAAAAHAAGVIAQQERGPVVTRSEAAKAAKFLKDQENMAN